MRKPTIVLGVAIGLTTVGTASAQQSTTITTTTETDVVREKPRCGLLRRPCSFPHLALAVEGGVSALNESGPFGFDTGVATVGHNGPSWGFRAGVELTSWFAIDAHYTGMS